MPKKIYINYILHFLIQIYPDNKVFHVIIQELFCVPFSCFPQNPPHRQMHISNKPKALLLLHRSRNAVLKTWWKDRLLSSKKRRAVSPHVCFVKPGYSSLPHVPLRNYRHGYWEIHLWKYLPRVSEKPKNYIYFSENPLASADLFHWGRRYKLSG